VPTPFEREARLDAQTAMPIAETSQSHIASMTDPTI
jgi:hypothetical protein